MSKLTCVKRGRLRTGKRVTIYGPEAVGKTTLASDAPNPIFIDVEDGSGELDVPRYIFREDDPGGHVPLSYPDVLGAVRALDESEHDFSTVVIDTIDRLQALIWSFICERDSKKVSGLNKSGKVLSSVESYGYGKGYIVALDEWRNLLARLDRLRLRRGMNIILLGHASVRTYKNPEGEDYDRYQLRVHDTAASFIKEWSDIVGFAQYEEGGAKLADDDARAKGWSTGRRLLRLERSAAYDAKSRVPMPSSVELSAGNPWAPFQSAIDEGELLDAPRLAVLIADELRRIGDNDLSTKVDFAISNAKGDVATLSRYLNNLRRRLSKEEN